MLHEPLKALNILVADDEPEIRELLGEYLTARGHSVRTAADGRAALALLDEAPADVLLTDIRMPLMEGVDLVQAIKEREQPIGVVVMTGFPTIESATTAMKLGASDYLLKPFRLRDVYSALMVATSRSLIEQRLLRLQHTVDFYEACNTAMSEEQMPSLLPLLLRAALSEVQGGAASLWLQQEDGAWSLDAAFGNHSALDALDVASVQAPRREADLLAVPLVARTHRFAVVAVAGPSVNAPERLGRLRHLVRSLSLSVERITAG